MFKELKEIMFEELKVGDNDSSSRDYQWRHRICQKKHKNFVFKSVKTEMKNSLEKLNSKLNMAKRRIKTQKWINKNYPSWRTER